MATNIEQLSRRIEEVVHAHLAAAHREDEAALVRAFGTGFQKSWRAARSAPSSKSDNRRSTSELAALRGQLYEAVLAEPGETIAVLALAMNSSAQELKFPMKQLKQAKHVRSAGERGFTRYSPMAVAKTA